MKHRFNGTSAFGAFFIWGTTSINYLNKCLLIISWSKSKFFTLYYHSYNLSCNSYFLIIAVKRVREERGEHGDRSTFFFWTPKSELLCNYIMIISYTSVSYYDLDMCYHILLWFEWFGNCQQYCTFLGFRNSILYF